MRLVNRRWVAAAIAVSAVFLVVLGLALVGVLHWRNAHSQQRVAAKRAQATVARIRQRAADFPCRRPPLLGTSTRVPTPVMDIYDVSGPLHACLRAARHADLLSTQEAPSQLHAPICPPRELSEDFERIEKSCDALPSMVDAVARTPDQCSPFRPGTPDWPFPNPDATRMPAVARAAIVLARKRACEGDTDGALRLLVKALAVTQDTRRGACLAVVGLASLVAEKILIEEFHNLLSQLDVSAETANALDAALQTLEESFPSPAGVFVGDTLAQWDATPSGETSAMLADSLVAQQTQVVLGAMLEATVRWCPFDAHAADCVVGLRQRMAAQLDLESSTPFIPEALRMLQDGQDAISLVHLASFLEQLGGLRSARIALTLNRLRATGTCPLEAKIPAALLVVSYGNGRFAVDRSGTGHYVIRAPSMKGVASYEDEVGFFHCPAAGGSVAR